MENKPKKRTRKVNYLRYSNIAFQMIAVLLLSAFLGSKLDAWLGTSPFIMIVLLLLGVVTAMYIVIKDLTKK